MMSARVCIRSATARDGSRNPRQSPRMPRVVSFDEAVIALGGWRGWRGSAKQSGVAPAAPDAGAWFSPAVSTTPPAGGKGAMLHRVA